MPLIMTCPVTVDFSNWFAISTACYALVMIGLGMYGFVTCVENSQSLFSLGAAPDELPEDAVLASDARPTSD